MQKEVEAVEASEVGVMKADEVEVEEPAEREATAEAARRVEMRLCRESWGAHSWPHSLRLVVRFSQPLSDKSLGLTLRKPHRRIQLVAHIIREYFATRCLQATARQFLKRRRSERQGFSQEQVVCVARQKAAARHLQAAAR